MSAFKVLIDTAQTRLKEDGLSILVTGKDWEYQPVLLSDGSSINPMYVDPICNMAMLRPGPAHPTWTTSSTGIFAKLGLSDFVFEHWTGSAWASDTANWVNNSADAGGPFMARNGANTNGVRGHTAADSPWSANQAFVVEWFGQQFQGSGPVPCLDLGLNPTSGSYDGTAGVSLRAYTNGHVEVWKAGVLVGKGSVSEKQDPLGQPQDGPGQSTQAKYYSMMVIPCRDRDLLIIGTHGGGFVHTFADLAEGTASLAITDSAPLWFYVPAPLTAEVRIAKLQYATSGTILSRVSGWRLKPSDWGSDGSAIAPTVNCYQALTQALSGLVAVAAITPGTGVWPADNPYSLPYPVKLGAYLTGGPSQTPFLYALRGWYGSQGASTATPDGGAKDLTPYVQAASLEVSDQLGGTKLTLTLNQPDAMATAGIDRIAEISKRPFSISDSEGVFLTGVGEAPSHTPIYGQAGDYEDKATTVEISVRDFWQFCEEFLFSDPIPLDGLTLADAVSLLCGAAQISYTVSTSATSSTPASGITLSSQSGGASSNVFGLMVQPGDKLADWLKRLHDDFVGTWFMDMGPNGEFQLVAPDDSGLPSTSGFTLYPSEADAIADGVSSDVAYLHVYRSLHWETLEAGANDVYVTGLDTRTQRPMQKHLRDTSSADPTLAPASRPLNWLGGLKKAAFGSELLTTEAALTAAATLYFNRVTAARRMCEFECEYMDGIWRGSLVTLKAAEDDGTDAIVRIRTLSGSFQQVGGVFSTWRPAKYCADDSATDVVFPIGVPGTTLKAIKAGWRARNAQNTMDRLPDSQTSRPSVVAL